MEQIKGAKYDDGKPRPSLVPVEAIEAIMKTREHGMRKYGAAEDWRSIDAERWHEALYGTFWRCGRILLPSILNPAYRLCGTL